MNVRQASLEVFDRIVQEGRLSGKLLLVYSVLHRYGPMTARETADLLARTDKNPAGHRAHVNLSALASLQCVRTVGRRHCRVTGESALIWDVTDSLPVLPSAPPLPGPDLPCPDPKEIERLRIENASMKLRLSRWGRPPAERKKDPASEPSLPLAGL